ncbi:MAG: hypothetical protein GY838_03735 [bacterium]|nr:hypothetical protein [bacterium]
MPETHTNTSGAPANMPPLGLCVPVEFRRCRDGDTPVVSFRGSTREFAVRLIGVDCPERNTPEGKEAHAFCQDVLEGAERLVLYVPRPPNCDNLIARLLSFDRILGFLYVDTGHAVNDMLLVAGHAEPYRK